MRRDLGTNIVQIVTVLVHELDHRTQVLVGSTALLVVSYDDIGQTGNVIGFRLDGDAFDKVRELGKTRYLSDNRMGMRIPGGENTAGFNRFPVLDVDHGTIGNLVPLTFTAVVIDKGKFGRS